MSATADELAEIEGIDSGMAFTIVEIISQNHFIDLHTVSRITGMRRKALKPQHSLLHLLFFLEHWLSVH
jgi:hypothetical protein